MRIWRKLYTIYGFTAFAVVFFALLPFFLLIIQRKSWHKYTQVLNRLWAEIFLFIVGIPVEREFRAPISEEESYVFAANHFSWLDIVLLGLAPPYFVFVGKKSLEDVPLFGYMYKHLHILVDRDSSRSRYETYVRCREAVAQGTSIGIFPEGGMRSEQMPKMAAFREGAFRIAIEQQIPLVPVTIPYNWKILPGRDNFTVRWHPAKIIFHEPIDTQGFTEEDVPQLKDQVYQIIQRELEIQNAHEN